MSDTTFKPGNPGRRKGAVNKTTRLVKEVFADIFTELQKDKKANLKAWAKQNPTEFYKLAAKLIPIQLTGKGGGDIPLKVSVDYSQLPDDVLQTIVKARIPHAD